MTYTLARRKALVRSILNWSPVYTRTTNNTLPPNNHADLSLNTHRSHLKEIHAKDLLPKVGKLLQKHIVLHQSKYSKTADCKITSPRTYFPLHKNCQELQSLLWHLQNLFHEVWWVWHFSHQGLLFLTSRGGCYLREKEFLFKWPNLIYTVDFLLSFLKS